MKIVKLHHSMALWHKPSSQKQMLGLSHKIIKAVSLLLILATSWGIIQSLINI